MESVSTLWNLVSVTLNKLQVSLTPFTSPYLFLLEDPSSRSISDSHFTLLSLVVLETGMDPKIREYQASSIPLKRFSEPHEQAAPAILLLSEKVSLKILIVRSTASLPKKKVIQALFIFSLLFSTSDPHLLFFSFLSL